MCLDRTICVSNICPTVDATIQHGREMNKLIDCFVQTFAIERDQVTLKLAYQSIPQWDSVGHMALVAEIENTFNITLDTDDIIGMSDVSKVLEILRKHGAALNAIGR